MSDVNNPQPRRKIREIILEEPHENESTQQISKWYMSRTGLVTASAMVLLCAMMIGLRIVALDSDAYPRLSWSSGLLTDEGFYIHNARNVALFGTERTDEFNNMLIMPTLHALQVLVFRVFGVGAIQARSISVVCCLVTLPLFFDALRRIFGMRVASVATVFLGLDHINLLYSRLALMDTPASALLICSFYALVRCLPGVQTIQARSSSDQRLLEPAAWAGITGALLGLSYATRGLTALVVPCFVYTMALGISELPRRMRMAHALAFALGLLLSILAFTFLWYLPHHAELVRVNRYYVGELLLPHDMTRLMYNVHVGLFDYQRGSMPYLLRHSPVQFSLACAGLGWAVVTGGGRQKQKGVLDNSRLPRTARAVVCLLAGWVLIFWLFLCFVSYAPSRYHVLFYPAMAALSAVTLFELPRISGDIIERKLLLAALGSYLICLTRQALLTQMEPDAVPIDTEGMNALFWSMAGALFIGSQLGRKKLTTPRVRYAQGQQPPEIWITGLAVWAAVNCYWTGDWLLHLTYRQRSADQWLSAHLPPGSTLLGAVAPGLCLNNRFRVVNVIANLCNDGPVLEQTSPPRYILILDSERAQDGDRWREKWWDTHYPALMTSSHCIHTFPRVLRPFFKIDVYSANASEIDFKSNNTRRRAKTVAVLK